MKNEDLISIIIPTRVSCPRLQQTLDSISLQTYKPLEVIIIVDLYSKGASWARNRGFLASKGEYLFFCDNDIILEKTCLKEMKNALDNSDASFAYCNFNIRGWLGMTEHIAKPFSFETLKQFNYISTMSLVKKAVITKWDEELSRLQDWDFWLGIIEQNFKGIWINKKLFTAYYFKDSMSLQNGYNIGFERVKKKHSLT